jgi:hypothetical protein
MRPVAGDNLFGLGEQAAAAAGMTLQQWIEQKEAELPIGRLPTADECAGRCSSSRQSCPRR